MAATGPCSAQSTSMSWTLSWATRQDTGAPLWLWGQALEGAPHGLHVQGHDAGSISHVPSNADLAGSLIQRLHRGSSSRRVGMGRPVNSLLQIELIEDGVSRHGNMAAPDLAMRQLPTLAATLGHGVEPESPSILSPSGHGGRPPLVPNKKKV